jgi:hypothetical protein
MLMKILHVTQYCHAGSTGGTERYIVDLVRGLDGFGVENAVAEGMRLENGER